MAPTADKARAVQHYQALAAEAAAQRAAPRLPLCIPTTYTDAAGHHCLAYPRSPWNPARYLVVRCSTPAGQGATDLECVHDDFGRLVPLRQRTLTDDWVSSLAWRPVAQEAAS